MGDVLIKHIKFYLTNILNDRNKFIKFLAIIGATLYFARDASDALFIRLFMIMRFPDRIPIILSSFVPFAFSIPYLIKNLKKVKVFLIIYLVVLVYFIISVVLNPQNFDIYFRVKYGIDKVFIPSGGMFAIYYIFLLYDKKHIEDLMLVFLSAATLLLTYNVIQYIVASYRGYWLVNDFKGNKIKLTYSLTFGQSVAMTVNLFIGFFLYTRKKIYLIPIIIGYFMILVAGNRAALFLPIIAAILYGIYAIVSNKFKYKLFKKELFSSLSLLLIFTILFTGLVLYNSISYDDEFENIDEFVYGDNIDSNIPRNIQLLKSGKTFEANGRNAIYALSFEGIKTSPILGLGAYGDRPWVSKQFIWGHSHNFILEVWSNLGLILGIPFGLLLLNTFMSMLTKKKDFIVVFYIIYVGISAIHMTSLSFWLVGYIWAILAFAFIKMDREEFWFNRLINKIYNI